jgi:putative DNA primase/helicase
VSGSPQITLRAIAKALNGTRSGKWINIRGPGHSGNDRSLGIMFDPEAPGGFRVHSLAGDDPSECQAHARALIQKLLANGSLTIESDTAETDETGAHSRTKAALAIWNEAQPILGTIAATYLASRNYQLTEAVIAADSLRFHPVCPFGHCFFPAMIGLMRDAISADPVGIQRTALQDDGLGKRVLPDRMPPKMMLGPAKHAAVMLQHASKMVGVAEGIETALSASQVFRVPVWSAMSADGVASFPIVYGIRKLMIFPDHDEAGLIAAKTCARRHAKGGIEVEIRCPPKMNTDWNDFVIEECK